MSLRSRSTIIRFSPRNFGSSVSSSAAARSAAGSVCRGVVPLIGRVSIHPSGRTVTNRSGELLSRLLPRWVIQAAYGAGLARRSRRYAVNGSSPLATSVR